VSKRWHVLVDEDMEGDRRSAYCAIATPETSSGNSRCKKGEGAMTQRQASALRPIDRIRSSDVRVRPRDCLWDPVHRMAV